MSYRLIPMAWAATLDPLVKLVLLRLVDHSNNDGEKVRPSVGSLALACGCSHRTVQNALRFLEQAGIIVLVAEADFSARRPREYRIDLAALAELADADHPANRVHQCTPCTDEPATPVHQKREPVHEMQLPGAPAAPKPTKEPSNKPSKELLDQSSENDRHKFEEFYEAYPRHVAKGGARSAYARAVRKVPAATILMGARRYADWVRSDRVSAQFIAHPATWLNQERWADDLVSAGHGTVGGTPRNEAGRRRGDPFGLDEIMTADDRPQTGRAAPIIDLQSRRGSQR